MVKTIGIIGFGQMGKILAEIFSARFDVRIFNRSPVILNARTLTVKVMRLEEVCSSDIVIFCISIQSLEEIFRDTTPFLKENSVILDIASVKEKPAKLMLKTLPKNIELLGTHPMFGPNSLRELNRKHIVFCPVRITKTKLREVKKIFEREGFEVFTITPRAHDKRMANSQLFLHLVANIAKKLNLKHFSFSPLSFTLMMKAFEIASPDYKLLIDLIHENNFGNTMIAKFSKELSKIKRQLRVHKKTCNM